MAPWIRRYPHVRFSSAMRSRINPRSCSKATTFRFSYSTGANFLQRQRRVCQGRGGLDGAGLAKWDASMATFGSTDGIARLWIVEGELDLQGVLIHAAEPFCQVQILALRGSQRINPGLVAD